MNFIETENLTFKYEGNDTATLNGITLDVKEHEFIAVLGTNGSGKSTFARMLNAILLPTSGVCRIKGIATADEPRKIRRLVGMVFQNPDNQFVAATAEDDVAFGVANLGIEREEIFRRVDYAIRSVDMEEYRRMPPHLLSGGQKQRVAIAGALAMQSECIVLDEPTAMLDPKGRTEVLATVKKLHDNGTTIIYVTHFMEEAAAADRIFVMEQGKIAACGTPRQIFADAKKMQRLGLDVPFAAAARAVLHSGGVELPPVLDEDELLAAILDVYHR